MTRNDYLKILREMQNELKDITIDFKKCDDNVAVQELKDELKSDKKRYKYTIIISGILIVITYNTDYDMFLNLLFVLLISGVFGIASISKIEKDLLENYKVLNNINEKCKLEISKIENCIEFFLETSEEELSEYLSYKIGG
ncbi:MAG: hypothetical protein J6J17_05360 [Bacilli bacterium]|nr:hypothetical protein [Bacilli bacterium]